MSFVKDLKKQRLVRKILKQGRHRVPLKDPPVASRRSEQKPEKKDEQPDQGELDFGNLEGWPSPPIPDGESLHEAVYSGDSGEKANLPTVIYQCSTRGCGYIGEARGMCPCCGSGGLSIVEGDKVY